MLSKFIAILALSSLLSFAIAEELPTRIGYAYDKETKDLIYTENHYEKHVDGIIYTSKVIYKDVSEKVFAEKTVDFAKNEFIPEFNLQNNLTGHIESTRFVQSKYEVVFSKLYADSKKDTLLNYPSDGISDAGFDNFIIRHWDELKNGEVFVRNFLIPSMMDFIKFRIYQDEVINEQNKTLRVINIEPDSFLIRAFAGTTKLFYENTMPVLKKFDGVSNMRDSNGDNLKVTIRYEAVKKLALN
jgi:hypothetical protein